MTIRPATAEDVIRIVQMGTRFINETPYARFGSHSSYTIGTAQGRTAAIYRAARKGH